MNRMMKKNALIIFVRNPELGKVKTRLAAQVGKEKALEIYIKLLHHTREVALQSDCDKFIFATEPLKDETWKDFKIAYQVDGDLGEKMQSAFDHLYKKGFESVVIIGSDCPGLSSHHIDKAFIELNKFDLAIGPANDGGYYLLGMNKLHPTIFSGKNWSTDSVYEETMKSVNDLGLSCYALETLTDVDEEKDLPENWR